jgi:nitrate/TMAO reductase-like tetraheme cytochrome c subunit
MRRWRGWLPNFSWRRWLPNFGWRLALVLMLCLGAGAIAAIVGMEFNKHTSTDAFCTGCHSMSSLTADAHYQKSAHVSNSAGVRPSCGTCHVPTNNFFLETWVHVTSGIRDVISEATTNFDDTAAWEAKRRKMASGVGEHMRGWGNTTCTTCHQPASIKPASQTGQVIHASLPANNEMACVSCHRNLVHSRPGAIAAADEQKMIKRATDNFVHARHLANLHAQKGLTCSSCHGNDLIPDANASKENAQCATCHGGMETVAQSHKGPSYLNPHASHLGNVACGSCHMAHQASKAYCLNCHTNFDMPIQGGEAAARTTGR